MITNPLHIGEGLVRFRLRNGRRFPATLLNNDRQAEVFWIERAEGCIEPIAYAELAFASIPLVQRAAR